ncbi:MAG: hypothetical protein AAFU60_09360 [Bacteroidota bacterium]
MFLRILSATLFSVLLVGCVQPPEYPIEPVIEFMSLSQDVIPQGKSTDNALTITIGFTDGDGDIGHFGDESENQINDLFVRDLRTGEISQQFIIWFVPEQGTTNGISGEISFDIPSTCCIFPDFIDDAILPCEPSTQYPVDTLIYEIYIQDRAGNESNRVLTQPIFLQCQ